MAGIVELRSRARSLNDDLNLSPKISRISLSLILILQLLQTYEALSLDALRYRVRESLSRGMWSRRVLEDVEAVVFHLRDETHGLFEIVFSLAREADNDVPG